MNRQVKMMIFFTELFVGLDFISYFCSRCSQEGLADDAQFQIELAPRHGVFLGQNTTC